LLPFDRRRLRATLAPFDVVVAVGAPVLRQNPFDAGPFTEQPVTFGVVTDDPDEAHRSAAELAVLGSPGPVCLALATRLPEKPQRTYAYAEVPRRRNSSSGKAGDVLQALGDRVPEDVILVEECPSNQVELTYRIPARRPLGFVSAANGGLGWGLNAAIGLRMGLPERPVVAVLGDGSTLFGVHGLWTAAHERAGALFVVLKNGGYRIMDQLAARAGGAGPWPAFDDVDIAAIARALGCDARRITDHDDLTATLDDVIPTLRERAEPLLLEVEVEPD
jgi:benzoylformate decarboxylase